MELRLRRLEYGPGGRQAARRHMRGDTASHQGADPVRRSPYRRLISLVNDERVRFVVVGGFNTVFGYLLFVLFEITTGPYLGYFFSLYASFAIASIVAFLLHRRHTFKVHGTGNIFVDFVRFISVYIVALTLNSIALPLLVEGAGMSPLVAQGIIVIITTVTSYFGHKYFSFRRKNVAVPSNSEHTVSTP
jgi:putative flippase GtrA